MFKENIAVAIKCDGKAVLERDGIVRLPFDTEYKIMLKNYDKRTALLDIDIDGTPAFERLVLKPNEKVELERFSKTNRKFKFMELTNELAKGRQNSSADGEVVIRFRFEKAIPEITPYIVVRPNIYHPLHTYWYSEYTPQESNGSWCSCTTPLESKELNAVANGCTVAGGVSDQKLHSVSIGQLEDSVYIMQFKLIGTNTSEVVYSRGSNRCPKCGNICKASNAFCAACGAALPKIKQEPLYFTVCPDCRLQQTTGNKFCPDCGKSLLIKV